MLPEESLYVRRVRQEWKLVGELARENAGVLEVLSRRSQADGDLFDVAIHQTSGIITLNGDRPALGRSHRAVFRFPRFFPCVPIEASLLKPVFHPNVDPVNGFVCLWTRASSGDTIMEAARRLQQIIAWKLVNLEAIHIIQPEAVEWASDPVHAAGLPLEFTPIVEVEAFRLQKSFAERSGGSLRRRLEPISQGHRISQATTEAHPLGDASAVSRAGFNDRSVEERRQPATAGLKPGAAGRPPYPDAEPSTAQRGREVTREEST